MPQPDKDRGGNTLAEFGPEGADQGAKPTP